MISMNTLEFTSVRYLNQTVDAIVFKDVSFKYKDAPVIKDFSLDIKPGQKVALVGPSETFMVKLWVQSAASFAIVGFSCIILAIGTGNTFRLAA